MEPKDEDVSDEPRPKKEEDVKEDVKEETEEEVVVEEDAKKKEKKAKPVKGMLFRQLHRQSTMS